MTEKQLLEAAVNDKAAACRDNYMITNTVFLDMYQQSEVASIMEKRRDVRCELYGGFEDAERRAAVFLPDYVSGAAEYFRKQPGDDPLAALRVRKDGFSDLGHRDYLGALMGLGIKREMIGDIIVDDGGCTLAVMKSVERYITENFTSAGRGSLRVVPLDGFDKLDKKESFELKRCYVSTMRCDAVISAAFGISRSEAARRIAAKTVFVNGALILKPDLRIDVGDKLVLRGSGKAVVDSDAGTTKKGRHAFIIKRFV